MQLWGLVGVQLERSRSAPIAALPTGEVRAQQRQGCHAHDDGLPTEHGQAITFETQNQLRNSIWPVSARINVKNEVAFEYECKTNREFHLPGEMQVSFSVTTSRIDSAG